MKTNEIKRTKPPRRQHRGTGSLPTHCPGCHKSECLAEKAVAMTQLINGEEITCDAPKWVCSECEAAFMSPTQATQAVKIAVACYQVKHDLLTAEAIKKLRKKRDWSVEELAGKSHLGVATIKRIEAGVHVQNQSSNQLLDNAFSNGCARELDPYISFSLVIRDSALQQGLPEQRRRNNWANFSDDGAIWTKSNRVIYA